MNPSAQIRAFVASHRKPTATTTAKALGMDRSECNSRMLTMVKQGLLTSEGEREKRTYKIGRVPTSLRGLSRAQAHERRLELRREQAATKKAKDDVLKALRPAAKRHVPEPSASIPCESYEEWLERGGKPLILPGVEYVRPTQMPVGNWP